MRAICSHREGNIWHHWAAFHITKEKRLKRSERGIGNFTWQRLTNSLKRALNAILEIWQQLLAFTQTSIIRNNPVIHIILIWQGSQMDQFWKWHPHSTIKLNAVFKASKLQVFNRSRERYWSVLSFVPYDSWTGQMSAAFVWEPLSQPHSAG